METILQGIPNVSVYLNDILVTEMRLKRSKCAFMLPSIEYLENRVSAEGIQPTNNKMTATCIMEAPTPQNVTQLQSFFGMLNY